MRKYLVSLTVLSILLAPPALLRAQHDDKHDKKHDAKHADGKHGHKYEVEGHDIGGVIDTSDPKQLDKLVHALQEGHVHHVKEHKPFNPLDLLAVDLGLWALVVFIILFLILKNAAWGPMLEGLQKREQTIRAAVDEAKDARKETERVRAEFKAEMDKAYAEIPKMMEEARRDAQNLAEEMRSKAIADIQTERQRLRREIDTARDQALQDLWNRAAELATLISSKAIKRSLSEDDHRRLVDDALNELRDREKLVDKGVGHWVLGISKP
jgi:F-type H+-transporting ATPase subunit b